MNQQTSPRWEWPGPSPGLDPARGQRYAVQIPIEVSGFNLLARFFTESSETSNVSERGCRFCLHTEIAPRDVLAVRVLNRRTNGGQDAAPVLFQVVRVKRNADQWVVGALKLQSEEPWPASFPDARQASGIPGPRGNRECLLAPEDLMATT